MVYWAIFVFELIFLFLTSKVLFNSLFLLFRKIFKSQKVSISTLSLIFFPGVLIHELSHLMTAELLFVRTFEVELVPKIHEGRIKMGSVQVRETDFFRRFLIGIAPIILGSGFLFLLLFYFSTFILPDLFSNSLYFVASFLIFWAVFAISNTMFSSRKDLEGVVGIFFLFFVFGLAFFLSGVNILEIGLKLFGAEKSVTFAKTWDYLFFFPVLVNLFIFSLSLFFKKIH